jgi:hypothetical protein
MIPILKERFGVAEIRDNDSPRAVLSEFSAGVYEVFGR